MACLTDSQVCKMDSLGGGGLIPPLLSPFLCAALAAIGSLSLFNAKLRRKTPPPAGRAERKGIGTGSLYTKRTLGREGAAAATPDYAREDDEGGEVERVGAAGGKEDLRWVWRKKFPVANTGCSRYLSMIGGGLEDSIVSRYPHEFRYEEASGGEMVCAEEVEAVPVLEGVDKDPVYPLFKRVFKSVVSAETWKRIAPLDPALSGLPLLPNRLPTHQFSFTPTPLHVFCPF
uniref:Uncharacterized protein n=1 Tax=Chromera velia CCMP2878 TaxID=1169474 RepID=A0A0K6S701_9ALVE|eukprot:Cvel_20188.t1-p1 / transcript=Cvel_20188.t1 / gene=Cvel_20188 / organism=Chromera_velia_CCMP2878 / gene_product=hypothetical protein / transcript_product=hypothetical protein / location=Cvel_scaffold1795:14778-18034(-) / protein_length=230 / sequence_SO=supercontig / SO=protein_coding / is_pseudo=false